MNEFEKLPAVHAVTEDIVKEDKKKTYRRNLHIKTPEFIENIESDDEPETSPAFYTNRNKTNNIKVNELATSEEEMYRTLIQSNQERAERCKQNIDFQGEQTETLMVDTSFCHSKTIKPEESDSVKPESLNLKQLNTNIPTYYKLVTKHRRLDKAKPVRIRIKRKLPKFISDRKQPKITEFFNSSKSKR